MPINIQDYPPNWKELSSFVREEAYNQCEWCGAPNGRIIRRLKKAQEKELHLGCSKQKKMYSVDWERVIGHISIFGSCIMEPVNGMSWARLRFHGLTRIILTVAHLDRDSKNNARENLAALCQRCHLRHDIHQHIANRRYGRAHAKEQQGRLDF